ncbi:MAG: hypothetical protein ACWIPJ_00235 [Polaribacter sp.]
MTLIISIITISCLNDGNTENQSSQFEGNWSGIYIKNQDNGAWNNTSGNMNGTWNGSEN